MGTVAGVLAQAAQRMCVQRLQALLLVLLLLLRPRRACLAPVWRPLRFT